MKKLFIGTFLLIGLAMSSTSCGGEEKQEVNNDTVVSESLTDSLSMALGECYGYFCQQDIGPNRNVEEFIKGLQLVVGHNFTRDELEGIMAGYKISQDIKFREEQGIAINRDLFLQQFRSYIQNRDINPVMGAEIYHKYDMLSERVENILSKREEMRKKQSPDATLLVPMGEYDYTDYESLTMDGDEVDDMSKTETNIVTTPTGNGSDGIENDFFNSAL